jgi:hypoxanthine phosphoribosyltransferase
MSTAAKQDPAGKTARAKAADGKVYFSYAQIHTAITGLAPKVKEFKPDLIIAIGGGGFVPARMLRTIVKVPILAISLELYDDATCTARDKVVRKQWYDIASELGEKVPGGRVLIVDEVDDTRTTLEYAIKEVMKDGPSAVAVACVHNKKKEKKGRIPEGVLYMSGEDVEDHWNCYPWDADGYGRDIYARMCCQ